jgi:predicted MFS family arabinose efflux permease
VSEEQSQTKISMPWIVLISGALCVLLILGIRGSYGLFLKPQSIDLGWGREVFAFAIAMQNLLWGVFQPFVAAFADKAGAGKTVAIGGILYVVGLLIMSTATDPLTFQLSAGVIIGMAQAAAGNVIIIGVVGRVMPPEKRTWAIGIVISVGASGQFLIVPLAQILLSNFGWASTYAIMAGMASLVIALAVVLGRAAQRATPPKPSGEDSFTLRSILVEASQHNGYRLLIAGFFVCGFHVAFISVHLPAYLTDLGMPAGTGAWSLALIGFFNVLGSYVSGVLSGRYSKKYLLSGLYTGRAIVILAFIMLPISTGTVFVFSAIMGFLWLSTVPPTSGLVAQIFGTRYMGTLFAIVFFSHQVGAFFGVWLGGYFFDNFGSYMPVWWAGIALALTAAALHLPINDKAIPRFVNG